MTHLPLWKERLKNPIFGHVGWETLGAHYFHSLHYLSHLIIRLNQSSGQGNTQRLEQTNIYFTIKIFNKIKFSSLNKLLP